MLKEIIFDANAILRYILNDIPEQADITENILQNNKIFILSEVVAEVIFVMFKFYKIPRNEVASEVIKFLNEVKCDNKILIKVV